MKKGQSAGLIFIVGIFLLFIVGFVWAVFTPAFMGVQEQIDPMLNDTMYQDTAGKITSAWNNWPIFAIIVLIVVVLVYTSRSAERRRF